MIFVPGLVDIEEVRNVRGLQADRQTNEQTDKRIGDVQHKIRKANYVYSKRTAFSFAGKEKKGYKICTNKISLHSSIIAFNECIIH